MVGERKAKEKKKQPPYTITYQTMWKRTRWRIQKDNKRSGLTTG